MIYNYALYNWKLAPSARYCTFKYNSDLEIRVRVTEGHRKLHHSMRHPWIPINVPYISHRFRDKRRYPSKIANFSHPSPPHVLNAPDEAVPLGIWYQHKIGVPNASMMGLPDGRKSFKIGFDTIPAVTDRQPLQCSQTASHVAVATTSKDAAYYVARPARVITCRQQ